MKKPVLAFRLDDTKSGGHVPEQNDRDIWAIISNHHNFPDRARQPHP